MSDVMSITDMLARLRDDAADERFEGARLGPTAVRELLRHVDALRRERDEAREQVDFVDRHLSIISGVLGSAEPIEIDDVAARLHLLIAERDELAARLAEIDRAEPVELLRTVAQQILRDIEATGQLMEWSTPLADALSAAPERAEPSDAELVAAEWPDGFEQAVQSLPTLADAVALLDEPERAEPAANELPTRCTECGQLGWHKFGCSHVAHERGLRVTAQSSDSTSCPRGER